MPGMLALPVDKEEDHREHHSYQEQNVDYQYHPRWSGSGDRVGVRIGTAVVIPRGKQVQDLAQVLEIKAIPCAET